MQTVYDQYFITLYNIVYTSLPVLAMGVFDQVRWGLWGGVPGCARSWPGFPTWPTMWEEGLPGCPGRAVLVLCGQWWRLAQPQRTGCACLGLEGGAQRALCPQDVPEQRSMEYPKLYEPGQLNLLFNKREFFICIVQGIYTSVLMFFIPYGVFTDATRNDGAQLADYQSFAVTVATSLVIVVSVQVGKWLLGPSPLPVAQRVGEGLGPLLPCSRAQSTATIP